MTTSEHLLYVSGYASASEPGIHALTFNTTSGQLTTGWSFAGIVRPSFIKIHPNRRWLYAVSETSQQVEGKAGQVWALALSEQNQAPVSINMQPSGGDWPCHLEMDASGRWLFVANYASGTLGVFPIQSDGSLGEISQLVQHHGHGPNAARQEGPHIHSSTFTPDQRFLLVADLGLDLVSMYSFDAERGQLQLHQEIYNPAGSGPRHMAFAPNGRDLYISRELNNTVGFYTYDHQAATLVEHQDLSTLPVPDPKNTAADIHLSADGQRVYVSNRGEESIAVFARTNDGQLESVANRPCGGSCPRQFGIAPGGEFLVIANQNSSQVSVLPLDQTGVPGKVIQQLPITGASCIQFVQA